MILWCNNTKSDERKYYILGWLSSFYESNGFQKDDTICFELTKNGDKPVITFYRVSIAEGDKKLLEQDFASFNSTCCRYFRSIVSRSNLSRGLIIIPKHFARQNGLTRRKCDMVLTDIKGRSHMMKLGYEGNKDCGSDFLHGKRSLYNSYGLEKGDIVIFELICNGDKPIMKIYCCTKPVRKGKWSNNNMV
ncbi:B3 domain-containing protein REM14 [Spinacia oleracea]|uniref:B3 domain-containing protein REM14 n=1 Tax=Spinacia oleracea TaxID=3562 RepID=A0ABM3RHR4_SPIOL|nr:B3 domain-containing protein REM14-like [Spinacia oleracea]